MSRAVPPGAPSSPPPTVHHWDFPIDGQRLWRKPLLKHSLHVSAFLVVLSHVQAPAAPDVGTFLGAVLFVDLSFWSRSSPRTSPVATRLAPSAIKVPAAMPTAAPQPLAMLLPIAARMMRNGGQIQGVIRPTARVAKPTRPLSPTLATKPH